MILIAGASGYVGGRLLRALESSPERLGVRCLARHPDYLRGRVASTTEVVQGDIFDPPSLHAAMQDVEVAYYLVPFGGGDGQSEDEDRRAALAFGAAARRAGVRRLICLGALGSCAADQPAASSGDLLRQSGVPVVEFRAFIIIGSGSLGFEMLRSLVERLPVLLVPRWMSTKTQPIAIEDLVAYLVEALHCECEGIFEIGGTGRVSYSELMQEYARIRGLRLVQFVVPLAAPRLSSWILGLITPLYARAVDKVICSLQQEREMNDSPARDVFAVRPRGVREAIERALSNEDRQFAETRWSDALSSTGPEREFGGVQFGSRLVESQALHVPYPPGQAFQPVRRIGGATGWYDLNWLWRLRGFLDVLMGGVGLRRGRRHPEELVPGDTVDFWRVEAYEPDRLLRLFADMKLPGRAWLQLEVEGLASGSILRMSAIFDPIGILGLLYWYSLYPVHKVMFGRMLRAMAREMAPAAGS